MRVVHIIPNLALAGAETMCGMLSVELKKLGVDVSVVSLYDYHSAITERLDEAGVPVYYLGKKRGPDPRIVWKLIRLFRELKPDVVHTHLYVTPYAIPAAVLAQVKVRIHTVHSTAQNESDKVKKFNYLFFRFANVIPVAISRAVQHTISQVYNINVNRIPVILNGVDLDRCINKVSYEVGEKLRFIHVGRFTEAKNHIMLVNAFSLVHKEKPKTELYFVGEGELEESVRECVRGLKLSEAVTFCGATDNVFPFLNQADVFVFPSKWEGLGIALAEAMASGLPAIATSVDGIPDLITDGVDGFLVDMSVESLAKAMLQMFDLKLRMRIGKAAKQKAKKLLSAQVMAEKYYELYKMDGASK